MIAICQDIRRPELAHLQPRVALLRAPGVSNSGICIDWLRVSGVPRFRGLSALYRMFIFIWRLSFVTSRSACGRFAKWANLILWMSGQEVAGNGCEVKSWPYIMRLVWLGEWVSHTPIALFFARLPESDSVWFVGCHKPRFLGVISVGIVPISRVGTTSNWCWFCRLQKVTVTRQIKKFATFFET